MLLRSFAEVRLEGSDFTRPKPLLLLCYLALEGPQERRFLAELFWPQARNHMQSLAVTLARIRKAAPGAIEADDTRVWTEIEVDAVTFLACLERRDLEKALELYRGPFLEDVHIQNWGAELEEWTDKTRAFLAAHARWVMLELAQSAASQGDFEKAAQQAEQAHALNEESGAQAEPEELAKLAILMLAGNSPTAADVQRNLEGEDISLPDSAEAARARLQASVADARTKPSRTLPLRSTPFVGRDLELTEIATLLAKPGCRLLTLLGPAGVGKTRLAMQVAQEQHKLGTFGDGTTYVSLESISSREALPNAIASALGLELKASVEPLGLISKHLGERQSLVICDSFEHLVEGAPFLVDLVYACSNLTLLVTSRERLNLAEEHIFPVPGLPFPKSPALSLDEALHFDAVKLFMQRAKRARPDFVLTPESLPAVIDICRLVEGLPLGLELAAVWVRVMPVHKIAEEIETNLDLLTTPTRNVPARHKSLRSAFEHSWALLSPKEQDVLKNLSVFRGGFKREAASAVAGATIPSLASLVDKSLLRASPSGRFDRHPLLYQYLLDKSAEHPEAHKHVQAKHGQYYITLLRQWEEELAGGARQHEALTVIEEELENVQRAWRWAASEKKLTELWEGCRPLQLFYIQRGGLARAGAEAFAQAASQLEAADASQRAILGRLLIAEAWFRYSLGAYDQSAPLAARGIDLLRSSPSAITSAKSPTPLRTNQQAAGRALVSGLNTLGHLAQRRGELGQAEQHFSEALGLAKAQENHAQIAIMSNNLALLKKALGAYQDAEQLYQVALELNRTRKNDRSVVRNLTNLGGLMVVAGNAHKAEQVLQESLQLAKDIGYHDILPHILVNLGGAAYALGRYQKARELYLDALERKQRDDRVFQADVHCWLGRVETSAANHRAAYHHLHRALQLAWHLQYLEIVCESLVNLSELHLSLGHAEEAAQLTYIVQKRPGLSHSLKERVHDLVAQLESTRSPDTFKNLLEQNQKRQLEQVVATVLETATPYAEHGSGSSAN